MIDGGRLERRPDVSARRLLWGVGAVLAAMLLATAALQARLDGLMGQAGALTDNNITWSFFQLETELHGLQDALGAAVADGAAPTPEALERLRERYEIFVSRIALVDPQHVHAPIPDTPRHLQTLQALQAFVREADPVLDAQRAAPPTPQALQALRQHAAQLAAPVHELSRLASHFTVERAEQRDAALREHQRHTLALTLVQGLAALGFAALLVRQLRAAARRQDELAELAGRLDAARAAAQVAHQGKRLFLANMSHELRTPFNGVLGMLDLLDDHRLDDGQRRALRTARDSTEQLLALLNDILDMSRLEDGQITLHPAPVELRALLASVHTAMRPAAEAKGLGLALQVAEDTPPLVLADATRLRQVLLKLLSNAIKFTEAGDVRLQVGPAAPRTGDAAAPADGGWLAFRVRDTGIAPSARALLFERFAQGDDSVTRAHGGAGVGLRIARGLARLMGGDIHVVSEPGVGSEFSLELPLPAVDAVAIGAPAVPARAAHRRLARPLDVLVAEDHAVNRQYIGLLLERAGHRVRFAADGAAAVAEAQRALPDLVLMDLHMPVLDGIGAIRALRSGPAPAGRVRIVAVTADADAATRARAVDAGADAHLTKPFRPGELEAALLELFGEDGPAPPDPAARAAPAPARSPAGPELLDVRALGELCGLITLDGVRPLLDGFFADEARAYADLLDGLERADRAALPTLAHRFKGSAQLLGCAALAAHASAIEQRCAGWGADEAAQAASALRRQWADTHTLCRRLGLLGGGANP